MQHSTMKKIMSTKSLKGKQKYLVSYEKELLGLNKKKNNVYYDIWKLLISNSPVCKPKGGGGGGCK